MLAGKVTDVSEKCSASVFKAKQDSMTLKVEALHSTKTLVTVCLPVNMA
jgi:hypothetical protein